MFWGNETEFQKDQGAMKMEFRTSRRAPPGGVGFLGVAGVSGFLRVFGGALVGLWWGLGGALVDATFNFNSNEVSIYGFYLFSICFVRV